MTTPPSVPPPEPPEKPALPRDLILFFVQFSVALNKSRAYPSGHPVLAAAVDVVLQNIAALFQRRPMLTIGVSRSQLFVDGAASDEEHPVLRDLAERLHRHQLAAIQMRPGIGGEEIADLFQGLAAESWRQGRPLGLEPMDQLVARWPHVSLEPLPLDQLELGDEQTSPSERQAERVWKGLVHSALLTAQEASESAGPAAPGRDVRGRDVARAIRARQGDQAFNRQVVGWMKEMGEKVGDLDADSPIRRQVDELFSELDQPALQQMLAAGASPEERTELLYRGARNLPVRTVMDLVNATATLSEKSMSHSLLQLLGKLADHVDSTRGPIVVGAEDVLRDSVRQLVTEWDEEDPSAQSHRDLLRLLSRPSGGARAGVSGKAEAGSLRVVHMALELHVDAPEVQQALLQVREDIGLGGVLELIERGTFAGLAVDQLWRLLSDPVYLGARLLDDSQDVLQVERVLAHLGAAALPPLLEALEQAESASRRRWLLRRIQEFGDAIGPHIAERLPGKPWFVQRNLLSLLGTVGVLPAGFRAEAYIGHEDGRVRREAYKLLFGSAEHRPGAIVRAAADPEPSIVRLALSAALEDPPPELGPRLLENLRSGRYREVDIRLLGIRVLTKRPTTAGREWLLSRVATKRGWGPFRRLRLEPKSAEFLAALVVLNQQFGQHAEVAAVLRLAESSKDPDTRAASRGVAPKDQG